MKLLKDVERGDFLYCFVEEKMTVYILCVESVLEFWEDIVSIDLLLSLNTNIYADGSGTYDFIRYNNCDATVFTTIEEMQSHIAERALEMMEKSNEMMKLATKLHI